MSRSWSINALLSAILLLSCLPVLANSHSVKKSTSTTAPTAMPMTSGDDKSSPPPIIGEDDSTGKSETPGPPITASDYSSRIGVVQADIDNALKSHDPSSSLSKAQVDILPLVRPTVIFQDSSVTVDNRPVLSTITRLISMKPASKRLQVLREVREQLIDVRAGAVAPSSGAQAQHSETLARRLLNKYEFGSDPIKPPSPLQEKMSEWGDDFWRWLTKIMPKPHGRPLPSMRVDPWVGPSILYTILAVVLAFLAYLIIRAVLDARGLPRVYRNELEGKSALALTAREQELVAARDYASLIELAKKKSDSGEFRDAYRIVYLAILVLLDSTGDLRIHRARTNWEYLYHIERVGKTEIFTILMPVTDSFDRIWYGYGDAHLFDYQEAKRSFEELSAFVLARTAAPTVGKASV